MVTVSSDIFRAYDIRGIVDETLTPETVYLIGKAIGSEAREQHETKVVIARDGRLSGPVLSEALRKGLLDSGCDVIDIADVPTPLLYFATNVLDSRSGVMLTGSHNPKNYNGLKIVIAGQTLSEDKIQDLYKRIQSKNFTKGVGKYTQYNIMDDYIKHISKTIHITKKLKIVVDAGNGIAGKVAPLLYKKLNCDVIEIFCEVDGNFPNHHPDPAVPANLQDLISKVKEHHADIGLAFDGDGDRVGVITNEGEIIWPDRQLMVFAKDVLSRHPHAKIIYDVKCTKHLHTEIKKYHGVPIMFKTGHSLIKNKMREEGALLAGEMSGHIFFKERWFGFDDGLYAAARLLEILSNTSDTSSELFKKFPNSFSTPELKILVTPDQRQKLIDGLRASEKFKTAKIIDIDGVRIEFEHSWGLMRGSNTTPHLVLRFEADNQENLDNIQHIFHEALLTLDNTLKLPF
ncbi:MAG TPA: phosphomannomutase/phosphoglucomutase [Gammaproteobacteria bacterium]|nr:phosphomannomutase/phosphoglucomutase [Gammaproteobacteria bacterium]